MKRQFRLTHQERQSKLTLRMTSHSQKIEVRNLTKRYGTTLAVDDLSFDVNPGLVTGFIGPNGSGKTTTMKLILGSTIQRAAR